MRQDILVTLTLMLIVGLIAFVDTVISYQLQRNPVVAAYTLVITFIVFGALVVLAVKLSIRK